MSKHDGELGILARRRIEAEIIKPIYQILRRDFGSAKAAAVIGEAVSGAALQAAREFAAREPGGADLQSFVALQALWEKDDALQVQVIASDAQRYDYDVTRCRYAEMYQEMGLGEIGHLLSCNRDEVFIQGYAPEVELRRSQTIMGGASHCDFRYRRQGEPDHE
ncbi:L-2-amino-thiazoline-4-carboxylic acid hydrolase [Pseudomonas flavescens]|uniref:L-2-amino-thiazoline-4-carboxylic acid hydrolase n=1 Tax=Phytopseudomonas flavescens TaxID=29435 RepID=A0A1G8LI53_9GAMM|nr:L-2-amino-thiazoline-4-carboxylic acid hydrolase [Pseudomonas flavescens]SDI55409.1 L-2-amino-thiazoline-4-carboxylic acid hydrolase [Pseudomonas flavescens]